MSLKVNAIKEKKGKKIMVLIYSHTFTLKLNCGNIGIMSNIMTVMREKFNLWNSRKNEFEKMMCFC